VTIPKFAAAEGRRLLGARRVPRDAETWRAESAKVRRAFIENVLGGFPAAGDLQVQTGGGDGRPLRVTLRPEPGIRLTASLRRGARGKRSPLAILLDLEGSEKAAHSRLAEALHQGGWSVVTVDLRATGALAWPRDQIGGAPDHNTAQWGLWVGRPLLGQWAWDVRRVLDAVRQVDGGLPDRVAAVGQGPAGTVALAAAAVDARITHVVAVGSLASYVSDAPYKGQRLGLMAPGILREVGDIVHLAALCLPRRVVIAGGVSGDGTRLTAGGLRQAFEPAAQVGRLLGAGGALQLLGSDDADRIIQAMR
jgi:hypothetical protein